jgi:hypothetical protein
MLNVRRAGGPLAAAIVGAFVLAMPAPAQAAPVMCAFRTATIVGTAGADVIASLGGDDTVMALGGNDIVCLGAGNDVLDMGAGNDSFYAEATTDGADTIGGGDTDNAYYYQRTVYLTIRLDTLANDGEAGEATTSRTTWRTSTVDRTATGWSAATCRTSCPAATAWTRCWATVAATRAPASRTRAVDRLARDNGYRRFEAAARATLATIHQRLGHHHRVVDEHQQALMLGRHTANRFAAVSALVGLADAYRCLGDLDRSVACAEEAIADAASTGQRMPEGAAHTALAATLLAFDRPLPAADHAGRAVTIQRGTGYRLGPDRAAEIAEAARRHR